MTDQTRMRLGLVLGLIGLFVLLGGTALLLGHQRHHSPSYTTKLVDRDTGEVLLEQPNKVPEANVAHYITIFGSQSLFDGGATQEQFQLVQESFTKYAQTNLGNSYQTLTIIPSTVKSTVGSFAAQLRLGQSDNTVSLTISLSQLKYVQVKITDTSGQNGGNYDSGLMKVPATTYQGTD